MKKLLTEWRKFLKEEGWRDTAWADDDHRITIGEINDYLDEKPIEAQPISIKDLMDQTPHLNLDLDPERIATANLEFPIIVTAVNGQYRSVLDGNHRLAKAALEGNETIKARILDLDAADIPEHWNKIFRPAVTAYHGSNVPIQNFSRDHGAQGVMWFSEDKDKIIRGESGALSSKYIMKVELNVENTTGWDDYDKKFLKQIEDEGFDSIQLDDDWIVFDPARVKVVGVEER